ncbi:hypothetical protein [Rhodopseudomonas faecalis]|uniref:hypothetical protein n=1 Tax=Rhodopseudomonas faecalis TaxID=99655 RepID=UPI001AECCF88|nr:hypothetical protein [Rhodopseudomonas faecalis]
MPAIDVSVLTSATFLVMTFLAMTFLVMTFPGVTFFHGQNTTRPLHLPRSSTAENFGEAGT